MSYWKVGDRYRIKDRGYEKCLMSVKTVSEKMVVFTDDNQAPDRTFGKTVYGFPMVSLMILMKNKQIEKL